MDNIIIKLKQSNLTGRGGASFPTALKWSSVAKAVEDKDVSGKKCYVICNASEGEPGILKDGYILENYPERVVSGIKIAIDFLSAAKAFIYLNPDYYKKFEKKLKEIIGEAPIELFKKDHKAGYIGGEETSSINHIEGKRIEPRLKPPFPTTNGLWDYPTLVNNVETLYAVSLIADNKYENKRFYTINGDCLWTGVYEFPENWTIEKILKQTKNYPGFDFFVQAGGDASGEVLNSGQLKRPVGGAASITVYSIIKYQPINLINKWVDFFKEESCGQCTPCREGTYRLKEILNEKEPNWQRFADLLANLSDTSFCGLGCAVPVPIRSYVNNVLAKMPGNKIKVGKNDKKAICECFRSWKFIL